MNNTIYKFVKTLFLVMKNSFKLNMLFESLIEYLIYLFSLLIVFKNIYISLTILFLIIFTKYAYKNILFLKQSVIFGDFEYLLVKPVNPIYRILIYGSNMTDYIIGLIILLVFIFSFPNYIFIYLSILIMLSALYLFAVSLLLYTYKFVSSEKIIPLFILILLTVLIYINKFSGLLTLPGQLSTLLFSSSLLFLSIKLWNIMLKKY